jgi:peroxiredoxin
LSLGVSNVFGISTQDTDYQREAKERLHLPYQLLSDEKLGFVEALKLPTFEWKGKKVIKRMSFAIMDGKILNVWYPVFPPDKSAEQVVNWLKSERRA